MDDPHRGQVLEFRAPRRTQVRRLKREAAQEALYLYRITAGFTDPCPPDAEMRAMFEAGMVEL